MKELSLKTENYAAEKVNELMAKVIAQAYADGYRDGYCEREQEIPIDLRNDKDAVYIGKLSSGVGRYFLVINCRLGLYDDANQNENNVAFL